MKKRGETHTLSSFLAAGRLNGTVTFVRRWVLMAASETQDDDAPLRREHRPRFFVVSMTLDVEQSASEWRVK